MKPRIGLAMIVRNESAVIERCLRSVLPHIAEWCIVDTGSTDDTVARVHRMLGDVPGFVAHCPWVNFGHNRTELLALARDLNVDYLLFMDADHELIVPEGFEWSDEWFPPAVELRIRTGSLDYYLPRLLRKDFPARYVGVTHEYLDVPAKQIGRVDGPWIYDRADGGGRGEKFVRDLGLLRASNQNDPRTVFYLAQTLRDLNMRKAARVQYAKRVNMGGWAEEVWYSLYQIAGLTEQFGEDAVGAYLTAYDYRPSRNEPLVELARYLRQRGQHRAALTFATLAGPIPPNDKLFIEPDCYGWRVQDEIAVNAWYAGDHAAGARASRLLLSYINHGGVPELHHERIRANAALYAST